MPRLIQVNADDLVKKLDQFYSTICIIGSKLHEAGKITKGEEELFVALHQAWINAMIVLKSEHRGVFERIGGEWELSASWWRPENWSALE